MSEGVARRELWTLTVVARALLRDAVLVMDEAVANLDAKSELALRDAIAQAICNRTTLLIEHRPSTIRTADRIVSSTSAGSSRSGRSTSS